MDEKNLNNHNLAKNAGLGQTFVRDIFERGYDVSLTKLLALARALGVSPGWLLAGEGEKDARNENAAEHAIRDAIRIRLDTYRLAMRQDHATFAEHIGVADYSSYETGDIDWTLPQLVLVCKRAGFSMDYLCFGNTAGLPDDLRVVLSAGTPSPPPDMTDSRSRRDAPGSARLSTKSSE